jgi:hypothetical protein
MTKEKTELSTSTLVSNKQFELHQLFMLIFKLST